ncbi:hypothetical protein C8N24_0644 [Solirubrobacter pauli]|uniref:ATP-grasp domain-containing protein n=2 Tax=Solirubrobacter pauli TaxID=166793 RepID=A0A660L8I8_9ACTN|nr:hypothetical protein C8N24_0644 [Solirubrobacter pauli]
MLVNTAVLESAEIVLHGPSLSLEGRSIALRKTTRGWIRRLAPPQWRTGLVSGSLESAVRSAWLKLVTSVAEDPDVEWVSPYSRMIATESKLLQARHAARLDIAVPDTVVSTSIDAAPKWWGDIVVVKPLGPAQYRREDGEAMVVLARDLARSDPRLVDLAGAPFLVQQAVPAKRHLRVVTVGKQAWTCALDARDLPLDWREVREAHHSFRIAPSPGVERQAIALANSLGVGYSSQDWIDTGANHVFLDLNPAGQWLFLPDPVSQGIAAAIAAFLRSPSRDEE